MRFLSRLAAGVGWCALLLWPCVARTADEAQLKAAIVYNILLFVEWPPGLLAAEGGKLVLCITPGGAVTDAFRALNGRELRGARVTLHRLAGDNAAPVCHAVFVEAADGGRLAGAVKSQRAAGALLLSDDPASPADTTAIVLHRVGSRIAFDVNLRPVRQAGLSLSSKLLRLARTVRE
ncbi:YfiR family protein [Piscinibacter sp.]|uniref:YfiR family protein n=1 Tax=Piscinibacter sp. TaxID=1903157 RepID=UPI002C8A6BC8|nr:YfiR family protein [Albitalea sp.]HUG25095.1 YfiR family protein [Albitalea sp.]